VVWTSGKEKPNLLNDLQNVSKFKVKLFFLNWLFCPKYKIIQNERENYTQLKKRQLSILDISLLDGCPKSCSKKLKV